MDSGKNSGKNGENEIEIDWGIFLTEFSVPVFYPGNSRFYIQT